MLIRSQSKFSIVNLDNISCVYTHKYFQDREKRLYKPTDTRKANMFIIKYDDSDWFLGTYSTEEKAIKVLDMIEKAYAEYKGGNVYTGSTFQMPEDNEVGK